MVGVRLPAVEVAVELAGGAVVGHEADGVLFQRNAGQHHLFRAQRRHAPQQSLYVRLVIVLPVGQAGHQAGLGDVGHGDLRLGHHLRHQCRELRAETGVQLAVVGHGGVDEQQRTLLPQQLQQLQHHRYLPVRGQIASIQRVEPHALRLPVAGHRQQLIRQIQTVEIRKAGVRAEYGGGQYGALHPHGGDHRQRHRLGAAAQTGHVLYAGNTFHETFLISFCAFILLYQLLDITI